MQVYVDRAFLNHCLALARLARVRGGSTVERIHEGAEFWRRLRKWESRGTRLALRLCNGPGYAPGEVEREKARIVAGVLAVLGRSRLAGLFVNGDPRGYAIKNGSERPEWTARAPRPGMHRDWGSDYILAPDFAGRS